MKNDIKGGFKIGDMVVPIEEEFRKTFQFGNTAQKMLGVIGNSCKILDVKNYRCGCQKKNGEQHTCLLQSMGSSQKIWLLIDGHKTPFSAKFFRRLRLS